MVIEDGKNWLMIKGSYGETFITKGDICPLIMELWPYIHLSSELFELIFNALIEEGFVCTIKPERKE